MKNEGSPKGESLSLKVNEIFYSLQGESTQIGRPCVFIRLTYCNLRCTYCDTQYAFFEGNEMSVADILRSVETYQCRLVEVTGGEPLIQKNVLPLLTALCDGGYEVMLETAGHRDISP
ncbi:MAG: radical SAM protein, partial [Calditrichales bacterium]